MTGAPAIRSIVAADPEALALSAADWLAAAAAAKQDVFAVSLAGGRTPRRLYELLASAPYAEGFPWWRTHWFFGDERFVAPDDELSNFRMVREALFSRAPVPAGNIHAVPTQGLTPEAAARAYEEELKSFYGADRFDPARPLFDACLLGLGPDGHTASLFPGSAALEEREHWVAAVVGSKPEVRITLTRPALESTSGLAFLVEGREKRAILGRLLEGDPALPAAHLRPTGATLLFADAAAAGAPGGSG
ncbi:MAG: 6-phosphogluconolactonase [Methylobacteriaceae bacterium]|nr:6-phosphogluconolactonase [Methylobacteriaceae bacterium]